MDHARKHKNGVAALRVGDEYLLTVNDPFVGFWIITAEVLVEAGSEPPTGSVKPMAMVLSRQRANCSGVPRS